MIFTLLIIAYYAKFATSARILGIVPTPSYSHQVTYRSLWAELSLRGHEVVVVTTDPMNNTTLTNLTEIDLHSAYDVWNKHDIINFMAENQMNLYKMMEKLAVAFTDVLDNQMAHPKVQELYNSTFDVVLAELVFPSMCAFSKLYDCPCIGIMSMELGGIYHESLGNSAHPGLYPEVFLPFQGKLNFWQRLVSSLMYFVTQYTYSIYMKPQDELLNKYFGQITISAKTLIQNVDLMLVNVNPILHTVRPVTPATVLFGGGTHISAPKSLPQVNSTFLQTKFLKTNFVLFASTARPRHP